MAKVTFDDGTTKDFLQPPEGEMTFRKPTMWENMRMGTSKQLERVMPGDRAQAISEFVIPGNATEAATQGALLGAPGVGSLVNKGVGKVASPLLTRLAQRGARIAFPGAVAGATAAIEGKPVGWETAKGLGAGTIGEGTNVLIESIARATGGHAMERLDARRLGKAVSEAVEAFGRPKSPDDLYKLAMTSTGSAALTEARDAALKGISDKMKARTVGLPNRPFEARAGVPIRTRPAGSDAIEVPSLRELAGESLMTLEQATNWLSNLGDQGWLLSQKLKEGLDAKAARALRDRARAEVVKGLDAAVTGAGKDFDLAMRAYAKGQSILGLLQEPGLWETVGNRRRLNMNALRDLLERKRPEQTMTMAQQLERRLPTTRPTDRELADLTLPEVMRFYQAIYREPFPGGSMIGRDVAGGVTAHGTMGASGPHIRFGMPHLPSWSGQQAPWWAQPGRLPIKGQYASTPLTFGALGLARDQD